MKPLRRPHWLKPEIYDLLLEREASFPHCVACGSLEDLTVDHIVPRRDGGKDELGNLQIMCRECNSRKGVRNDIHWSQTFFWDQTPTGDRLGKLRQAQKHLFEAITQDPYFERNPSEIARLLYTCAWIVGAGKTLAIPVAGWALNRVILGKWGRKARRVDRILVLCKEQAIRDQIADDIPKDLAAFGIADLDRRRVGIVKESTQFKQTHWLDQHDIIVCCIQQLWEKDGTAHKDLAKILAEFTLIVIDEPHFANEQVNKIVDAAASSVCIGLTGTPIDGAGALLQRMVALSVYGYQDAIEFDRSLKFISDNKDSLLTMFVREMNLEDAAVTIRGKLTITTTTNHAGYEKNIEPVKAVVRGCIEECLTRDALKIDGEILAAHRLNKPDIYKMTTQPLPWTHVIVYCENIATAEQMASDTNKVFESDRVLYPRELGYHAEVVHAGGDGKTDVKRPAKPLFFDHSWKRCHLNHGKIDSQCSRFVFVVGIGREGVNNPYCSLTGVAVPNDVLWRASILAAIQGWIGRQLRAVIRKLDDGAYEAPPAPLDTVRIITHQAFGVTPMIEAAIQWLCHMDEELSNLQTIAKLNKDDTTTEAPPDIEGHAVFPRNERLSLIGWMKTRQTETGAFPGNEEVIDFICNPASGNRKKDAVRRLADQVRGGEYDTIRADLRLNRDIEPITIVRYERLLHTATDSDLQRFVRCHHPDLIPDLADLHIPSTKRAFSRLLHEHIKRFQMPAITATTTINQLARAIGGSALTAVGKYYRGPEGFVWASATSAAKQKLGVPSSDVLADKSDWDTPQTHAIIRRPDVHTELTNWVIKRMIDEGHCPIYETLKS
jgi:hypothetical protein